jgi:hypothetical protein
MNNLEKRLESSLCFICRRDLVEPVPEAYAYDRPEAP